MSSPPMPPPVDPPEPGDPPEVGAYQVLGRLGRGGMGTVHLGRDAEGRLAAIKVVHEELTRDEEFRVRFAAEVENAQRVASFCTAQVLGQGEVDGRPYMVTEFIDGETLYQHVSRNGPLAPGTLHGVAVGVAAGLAAIHTAGLVHRDLKPANVILSVSGPRVIDFGIARALDVASGATPTGFVVGSPGWIAPEQLLNRQAGTFADVFSWACLIGYAGTGRHPFGRGDAVIMAGRVLHADPDIEGLPHSLRDLVAQAFTREPTERPTALQLLLSLVGGNTQGVERATAQLFTTDWQPPATDEPPGAASEPPETTGPPVPGIAPGPGPNSGDTPLARLVQNPVRSPHAGPAQGGAKTGEPEAGGPGAGQPEAAEPETGKPEAGGPGAGQPEAGTPGAGQPEAGTPGAGQPEAGTPGAGQPEAGTPGAGQPEAGTPGAGGPEAAGPGLGRTEQGEVGGEAPGEAVEHYGDRPYGASDWPAAPTPGEPSGVPWAGMDVGGDEEPPTVAAPPGRTEPGQAGQAAPPPQPRADTGEEGTKRTAAAEAGLAGTGPREAGPPEAGTGGARPQDAETGEAGPRAAASQEADPGQAGPGQTGPGQADPGQTGPGQTGPGQTGPGQTGPGQTGPGQTDLGDGGLREAGPGRSGAVEGAEPGADVTRRVDVGRVPDTGASGVGSRHRRGWLLGAVSVVVALALGGGAYLYFQQGAGQGQATFQAVPLGRTHPTDVGRPVHLGPADFTVGQPRCGPDAFRGRTAKGRFCLVPLVVFNNGDIGIDRAVRLSPARLRLLDTGGTQRTPTAVVDGLRPGDTELPDGARIAGNLLFDLPRGADPQCIWLFTTEPDAAKKVKAWL